MFREYDAREKASHGNVVGTMVEKDDDACLGMAGGFRPGSMMMVHPDEKAMVFMPKQMTQ